MAVPAVRGKTDRRQHPEMHKKGHCFDRAKEGYWHLLPVQSMRTKAPGDSKEMVAARRAFLNAGYYGIFGRALGELCLEYGLPAAPEAPLHLLDAGCGEGWYDRCIAQAFAEKGSRVQLAGFDIRKACGASGRKSSAHGTVCGGVQLQPAGAHRLGRPAAELLLALCAGGIPAGAAPGWADDLRGARCGAPLSDEAVLYESRIKNPVQQIAYAGFGPLESGRCRAASRCRRTSWKPCSP